MTERIEALETQLLEKDEQLQKALKTIEHLQTQKADNKKILDGLLARIIHDINNLNTKIRSSSHTLSHAFHDLRRHLPILFFQLSPEEQKIFLALLEHCHHNQQKHTRRLSSREERRLRQALIKELDVYKVENSDELADTLVDIGMYKDIQTFIPLLKQENAETVLQTAYSLMSLQDIAHWKLKSAYMHIMQIAHILRHSVVALLTDQKCKTRIRTGLETMLALYAELLERQQITEHTHYADIPEIPCLPGLELVWMNLFENAIEAIGKDGTLEVSVTQEDAYVVVRITDSGCGIPEEIRESIFDLSTTTKSRDGAHGAGLYAVRKIIDRHYGKIDVESQPSKTTFRIYLPIKGECKS